MNATTHDSTHSLTDSGALRIVRLRLHHRRILHEIERFLKTNWNNPHALWGRRKSRRLTGYDRQVAQTSSIES